MSGPVYNDLKEYTKSTVQAVFKHKSEVNIQRTKYIKNRIFCIFNETK